MIDRKDIGTEFKELNQQLSLLHNRIKRLDCALRSKDDTLAEIFLKGSHIRNQGTPSNKTVVSYDDKHYLVSKVGPYYELSGELQQKDYPYWGIPLLEDTTYK